MRYIALLLRRAFRFSLLRTDILAAAATALAPGAYWLAGRPMPEHFALLLSLWLFVTVGAVILLRIIAAPYLIWRDDQERILALKAKLGDPKTRMRHAIEERLIQDRIKALEFLNAHRIIHVIPDISKTRISDFQEFHGPICRLIADDPALQPIMDELETSYYRFLIYERMKGGHIVPDPEVLEYGAKFKRECDAAIKKLNDYLLVKDESPSLQSHLGTATETQP